MFTPILLLAFLSVSLGRPMDNPEWREYKLKFGKVYADEIEEERRYSIFLENLKEIEDHNSLGESYTKGVNDFSDMTHEEFREVYGGCYKVPEEYLNGNQTGNEMYVPTNDAVPNTVDWRSHGLVTRVKNQGHCGSCYTFSSTGALEAQWKKKTGTLRELSEQNLVDCTKSYGNHGCHGGWMDYNFRYIKAHGINSESYYPYYAKESGTCKFSRSHVVARDTGYKDIHRGNEAALKSAVASVGPVSVAIDARHSAFKSYRSGVYIDRNCGSGLGSLDHAVLVVGYGTEGGHDYWLVKNSWGSTWGANGYIKMARNHRNQCGIATKASYPTV